eukprot:753306-Rhodomonas_salina.1
MQTTAQTIAVDHSYGMSHCLHDLGQRRRSRIKSWWPRVNFNFQCIMVWLVVGMAGINQTPADHTFKIILRAIMALGIASNKIHSTNIAIE